MRRAEIEAVLVGVPLPATKDDLVRYAAEQPGGERAAQRLRLIPDREYAAIQDAGEEIEPVEPERTPPRIEAPHPESGEPPGRAAYVGAPEPRPAAKV